MISINSVTKLRIAEETEEHLWLNCCVTRLTSKEYLSKEQKERKNTCKKNLRNNRKEENVDDNTKLRRNEGKIVTNFTFL
jgi:hypothetical protein